MKKANESLNCCGDEALDMTDEGAASVSAQRPASLNQSEEKKLCDSLSRPHLCDELEEGWLLKNGNGILDLGQEASLDIFSKRLAIDKKQGTKQITQSGQIKQTDSEKKHNLFDEIEEGQTLARAADRQQG